MTRIVVAMSGGVDSAVSAWLLRERGFDVVGLFLRNGISKPAGLEPSHRQGCCSLDDSRDALAVANQLNIPFYVIDYASEFGSIIDSFVTSYKKGETPNPCVLCNRDLKFGSLLNFARSLGAGAVATGHYARIEGEGVTRRLRRGSHREKDQSYVLAAMEPASLASSMFPVGDLTKTEVREIAKNAGLRVFNKRESQEICFVPSNNYRDLLTSRGVAGTPGKIVNTSGGVLGEHGGFEHFTIGQRKGIGVAHTEALYVKSIDPRTATVTVATKDEIGTNWIESSRATWFAAPLEVNETREYLIQVRAHHEPVPGRICNINGRVRAEFNDPESAIAPGQLAVFYDGEYVAGSAWIERAG
ncbi:MAG: tRNA 2-thiouridine(34) synthase MnmA [Planctomycetota bacterium]